MEVLKKNYFDPKHPIAFAGVEKIYRWFKENGYKLSRTKIKNWLLKQEDYAINLEGSFREGESFPLTRVT